MQNPPHSSHVIEASATAAEDITRYYAQFLSKLWVTKGCRFEANRRLARKNQASLLTISFLSVYVIAGSLVTLIAPPGSLSQNTSNAINLLLVVTSILILVLSNIEAGKNYALRAHVMLKCAQQLSELYNDIELLIKTGAVTPDIFRDRVRLYDKIISDFSDNHDDVDYDNFQASHWKHFKLSGVRAVIKTVSSRFFRFLNIWGYYLTMLVPPPVIFCLVIRKAPAWLQ